MDTLSDQTEICTGLNLKYLTNVKLLFRVLFKSFYDNNTIIYIAKFYTLFLY